MADSMIANQWLTLKWTIPTTAGTWDTFQIFETGVVTTASSIVFKNKLQLERLVVDIATDWTCTIVLRWLDNGETKTEVSGNKKERSTGATGYICVLPFDLLDIDSSTGTKTIESDIVFNGDLDLNWDNTHDWSD